MSVMTPEEIHAVLIAEGEKLGLPKHYKNDLLVHDLAILRDHATQEFFWVARECGTHLIPLENQTSQTRAHIRAVLTSFEKDKHWYKFAHGRLTPMSPEDVVRSY